jgi:hypothetical protein
MPPAPGPYGMAPKLLLMIFLKISEKVDTPFHHSEAFGNNILVACFFLRHPGSSRTL